MLDRLITKIRRKSALSALDRELHPPMRLPVKFRTYTSRDFGSLLKIHELLAPSRFPANSQEDFVNYLETHNEGIFVGELKGKVISCASLEEIGDGIYAFCYGLVHPDHHRQRIGTTMTLLRITESSRGKHNRLLHAVISAVPQAMPFHKNFGFVESGTWTGSDGKEYPRATLSYHTSMAKYVLDMFKWREVAIEGKFRPYVNQQIRARAVKNAQDVTEIKFDTLEKPAA